MNEIRRLREQKNMTQAKLAELAGTSQPQIKRLEDGARKLTKEWAEKIAPHIGVTAEELLFPGREENSPPAPHDVDSASEASWSEFTDLFSKVSEEDQEAVLRLMRSLAAAKKE